MFEDHVLEVIRTYSGATNNPAFFIKAAGGTPCFLPQKLGYEALLNYFDFREILEFIEIPEVSRPDPAGAAYHTFHTRNYFIYNIVFMFEDRILKGAVIAGPILIYSLDEKRIEELMAYNKMPLHKKPELRSILKALPLASARQVEHSGKLLLALCTSDAESWAARPAVTHGRIREDAGAVFERLAGSGVHDSEKSEGYRNLYQFIIELKEKIKLGKTAELTELLNKSTDILWTTKTSKDIYNSLKNNCIILCSLSCIYAIQAKAPLELMLHLQFGFLEKIETLKTSDEIVAYTMTITRTYAHAVSVLACNTFSMHVNRALQYIKAHYSEDITLEILAGHTRITPVYLSGLIKKETKLSLSDNINKIRIEHSKNLLIYTNKPLNEIAHAVGYNYQNHFSLTFKRFTGVTPFEFRKKHAQNSDG